MGIGRKHGRLGEALRDRVELFPGIDIEDKRTTSDSG
jgi:hypothetical protein